MDKVLLIKTVQISPFKILINALKDIVEEVNMVFTSNGIKIVNMDVSKTVVVYLELFAKNFEFFKCDKEKIIIGINILHFSKMLNGIDNDETLSMYINDDEYNGGIVEFLTLQFDCKHKNQISKKKLKLIELGGIENDIPNVSYSSVINMPSTDLQKIIKDLNSMGAETVEIKSLEDEIRFKALCSHGSSEIVRNESDNLVIVEKHTKIIQGIFSLKNLQNFVKCTNLCGSVELYLDNDTPLLVKYNVASLGELKLGLSQMSTDNHI